MSDRKYDAALELEMFCDQMISQGFQSVEDFPLQDRIKYYSIVVNHEEFALSGFSEQDKLEIMAYRLMDMVTLGSELIIKNYCE